MELVLDYGLLLTALVSKLLPKHRVSGGNSKGMGIHFGPDCADSLPNYHHSSVENLGVALNLELALPTQSDDPAQHIFARNFNMCQSKEPVVLGYVADLRAYVSALDPW